MVYTVTFNPAIDYVVYISGGLKLNDINRNASEEFQFGGKGINVSNMLRTNRPQAAVHLHGNGFVNFLYLCTNF